jgi:hypothetical protein
MRGVNPLFMSARNWLCRGSASSMSPILVGLAGRTPCSEVKSS